MKISIITVSRNSVKTIEDTINSVLSQTCADIEYIIIDGASDDGTTDLINKYASRITKFVSEPDSGIYEAINKGLRLSTGDIVGLLNSDDVFVSDDVIEKIARVFRIADVEAVYGDVVIVKPDNPSKVVRYYSSRLFRPEWFRFGKMPAHPGFFARRELFDLYGNYREDYLIAADFELMIRFIYHNRIKCQYIGMPLVVMKKGGVSNRSFRNTLILNREIRRACRDNGLKTNYFMIYSKYFHKVFEFFPYFFRNASYTADRKE